MFLITKRISAKVDKFFEILLLKTFAESANNPFFYQKLTSSLDYFDLIKSKSISQSMQQLKLLKL